MQGSRGVRVRGPPGQSSARPLDDDLRSAAGHVPPDEQPVGVGGCCPARTASARRTASRRASTVSSSRCSRSAPKSGRDPLGDAGFGPGVPRRPARRRRSALGRRFACDGRPRRTCAPGPRSRSPELTRRAAREGPESVQAAQFGKMLVPGLGPHRVVGEDGPPRHVGVRTVPRTRHQAGDALHVRGPQGQLREQGQKVLAS